MINNVQRELFSIDVDVLSFKIYLDNNTIFIGWYDDQDSMMNATVEITQGSINLNARSVTVNGDSII